jgi:hypothetical protein
MTLFQALAPLFAVTCLSVAASNLAFAQPASIQQESPALTLLTQSTDPAAAVSDYAYTPSWTTRKCQTGTWTLKGNDPAGRFASLDINLVRARPLPETAETPTVIIMPPTGGGTVLDNRLMKIFCDAGIRTLLIRGWTGDLEQDIDPATHDRGSLRGVAAIRQTLSFFGISRAGVYGTSLGGIIASTAAGVDSRIDALVTTVAGGNVLETLSSSDQEILARLRSERMQKYDLKTQEEYREFLARAITINASDWTRPELRDRTWLVVATEDTTVPTRVQNELWEQWGRPRRTDISSGHIATVVWVEVTYAYDFARFFKEKLAN